MEKGKIKKCTTKQLRKGRITIFTGFTSLFAEAFFEKDGILLTPADTVEEDKYYFPIKGGYIYLQKEIREMYQFSRNILWIDKEHKKILGEQIKEFPFIRYEAVDKKPLPDKKKMDFIIKQTFPSRKDNRYRTLYLSKKLISHFSEKGFSKLSVIQHAGRYQYLEIRPGYYSSQGLYGEVTAEEIGNSYSFSLREELYGKQIRWYAVDNVIYGFLTGNDEVTKKTINQEKEKMEVLHVCPECAEMKEDDDYHALKQLVELVDLVKATQQMINSLRERISHMEEENADLKKMLKEKPKLREYLEEPLEFF